ncbi:MAG: response regulator [Bdellovibrionales bacterium]|nr:response regulator [Oligoflexia bacterium]
MAGKKILVADDSLTIQKVIRLALSGDGYEIQTVSDGKEALEQASLFRPDICIIDVSLPHYDAYQIREHLIMKPDLKNIPVILMSSAFEKVDEPRAQKLGFAGHLIKPFDPSHLRSTLLSVATRTPTNDPVTATINEPMVESRPPEPMRFDPPSTPSMFQDLPPLTRDYGADDIQELAKNTFEMSGLNQQDWGMIEPGKMSDPFSSEPSYAETTHDNEVSHFDMNEVPHEKGYSGDSSPQVSITTEELEQLVKSEVAKLMSQMQGEILEKLEHELKQYSNEFMPNLAERIIKEEIHKLLTHPPM